MVLTKPKSFVESKNKSQKVCKTPRLNATRSSKRQNRLSKRKSSQKSKVENTLDKQNKLVKKSSNSQGLLSDNTDSEDLIHFEDLASDVFEEFKNEFMTQFLTEIQQNSQSLLQEVTEMYKNELRDMKLRFARSQNKIENFMEEIRHEEKLKTRELIDVITSNKGPMQEQTRLVKVMHEQALGQIDKIQQVIQVMLKDIKLQQVLEKQDEIDRK